MIEKTITNLQKINFAMHPVDDQGQPEEVDGVPTWNVVVTVPPGLATVVPAADGKSADLVSQDGGIGDTTFLVDADADLGGGVVHIQDTILLHVIHPMATQLGLTSTDAVPK